MPAVHAHPANAPRKSSGAWLSLFAMLMIFIGPLISQSMPMEHHASMPMSASMPADMDMSQPSGMAMDDHSGHHAAPRDTPAVDHIIWAKCGYCTLLFSCPALTQTVVVIAAALPRPADFYNATPHQGHAERKVFPNARSRAPPFTSVA